MWPLLSPGQKVAALVGVPCTMLMLRGAGIAVSWLGIGRWDILILFPLFFILPYVYVRGIGTGVAVGIDLLTKK